MKMASTAVLPQGEEGELALRGPQVMVGYWNKPEETAHTKDEDGWLYTGDIARMDEDGYFYIVDRKKDLIIASGYNIVPREVEEVLFEYPKVLEAVVVGIPDPKRGETVKAYVVLKEGESATSEEIKDFCKENLAPYKVPYWSSFAQSFPSRWWASSCAACWWRKRWRRWRRQRSKVRNIATQHDQRQQAHHRADQPPHDNIAQIMNAQGDARPNTEQGDRPKQQRVFGEYPRPHNRQGTHAGGMAAGEGMTIIALAVKPIHFRRSWPFQSEFDRVRDRSRYHCHQHPYQYLPTDGRLEEEHAHGPKHQPYRSITKMGGYSGDCFENGLVIDA